MTSHGHGRLVLVRHGQTQWSRDGRHTGLTDLPLLPEGEADAASLRPYLARFDLGLVLSSDLGRALRTAELAGLTPEVDPDLREWDYGGAEGRTTEQVREDEGGQWTVFDGVPPGQTPGETVEEVAARASRVLARVRPVLEGEHAAPADVCLVGHGHALRILTAVWLGHSPRLAAQLELSPGSLSLLGRYRDDASVVAWNVPAAGLDALV